MALGAEKAGLRKAGWKPRGFRDSLEAEFLPSLVQLLVFAGSPWLP